MHGMPRPNEALNEGCRGPARLIDPDDPAFREIMQVCVAFQARGLPLTDSLVEYAIERGRTRQRWLMAHWCVYYARQGNRVKIGTTTNLKNRMSDIQPEEVLVTEPGGVHVERDRHRQFATLRTTGEWFRYEGALVRHVRSLQDATPGQ